MRKEYSKGTMPARNKKNFRPTKSGAGMTRAGVKAYRRLNPGSKLKTAVTGKVKPGSKAAKRRKSYCARSLGQLKRASAKTRNDPNSRIRQARRRWKCFYVSWFTAWVTCSSLSFDSTRLLRLCHSCGFCKWHAFWIFSFAPLLSSAWLILPVFLRCSDVHPFLCYPFS